MDKTKIQKWAEYRSAGLHVFPVKDKKPTVPSWKSLPENLQFNGQGAMACGTLSGGVEVVDIDCKNDPQLLDHLQRALEDFNVQLPEDVVYQTTVNAGMHIIYRCTSIEGNQVLARSEDGKALIETRGEGGYVVIAPTPGYEIKQGNLTAIPVIEVQDRESLLAACRSLNRKFEEVRPTFTKPVATGGLTPWADFDQRGEVDDLLQLHGWRFLRRVGDNLHYCRPGKESGTSATWSESKRLFYVFTTSSQFEPGEAFSASAVFAYVETGKDFAEAARKLREMGYGSEPKDPSELIPKIPPRSRLRMTFNYKKRNDKPALLLHGTTLINFGEIFTLVGLPGQGKSAICEAIICAHMGQETFGFTFNSNGKKALFIDTERPPDDVCDSYHNIARRMTPVRLDADGEIDGLIHLALSEFGKVAELKGILERELSSGEFDLVVLDGILDFSLSMNDDQDATEVVKWVRALAVKYNCAVVCTTHPNKNSETIAGHLGSFLYRWCRAILYVRTVQGDKSVKELTGAPDMAKLSHGDLGTLEPVYLAWDPATRLLQPTSYQPPAGRGKEDRAEACLRSILAGGKRMRYSELVSAIQGTGKSDRTAKRWIKEAVDGGLLNNNGAAYSIVSSEVSLVSGPL